MGSDDSSGTAAAGWRFKLGIAIFVLAFASWLLVPLAIAFKAPATAVAKLTGTLFITNKLLLVLVVAVMGKSGFQQLKKMAFGYLTPAPTVGPVRHVIGLIMFCLPLISSFLEPYIDHLAPGFRPNRWEFQLLGDLMFIASFFVLGGNFWDKVRALFVRTARVVDA
jgi:hypothetical protein